MKIERAWKSPLIVTEEQNETLFNCAEYTHRIKMGMVEWLKARAAEPFHYHTVARAPQYLKDPIKPTEKDWKQAKEKAKQINAERKLWRREMRQFWFAIHELALPSPWLGKSHSSAHNQNIIDQWPETKKAITTCQQALSWFDVQNAINQCRKTDGWFKALPSVIALGAGKAIYTGYQKFLRGESGPVKFKKNDYRVHFIWSVKTVNRTNNPNSPYASHAIFPKIGAIELLRKDYVPIISDPRPANLSFVTGKWEFSIQASAEIPTPITRERKLLGVDVGVRHVAASNDGRLWQPTRTSDGAMKRLRSLQKKLKRQVKGSENWFKTKAKIQKFYKRHTDKRNNDRHLIVKELLGAAIDGKLPSTIVVETLDIKEMNTREHVKKYGIKGKRGRRYQRFLHESAPGMVLSEIKYKSTWNGIDVVEADKWFASTQICSSCKGKMDVKFGQKDIVCEHCGIKHYSDTNAAKNLEDYVEQHVPKEEDKPKRKMFNWKEFHKRKKEKQALA